ncbi:hypothetical protein D5S18_27095 [Nocardia panacis]|uniref:DUF8020 domain-containing protein n=1 Tax=Nocardia panacis TaxID=2340916 RepID=A0A3A4K305_9NOCA|nr:hypothetical protein [Nocardia panacis]RJO70854.1 hypothetical protein D5S18_27095 [Nocardia panacis]
MRFTKIALLTTAVGTALTVAAGASSAAPQADAGAVDYAATTTERNTVIRTEAGSMVVEDGVFKIKARNGVTVAGSELSFRVDDFVFPIAADIAGDTATLTPQFDRVHARYQPVALPFEDKAPWKSEYDRENAAWSRMTGTIALGASIGTLVGGLGGAAIGCVLGGIAGATIASATIVGMFGPFIPAAAVGCVGGVLALGALGTVAGQILITAPVAIMAAVQYFTTINQPFNPPAK